MKSFFNKLSSPAPAKRSPVQSEQEMPEMLTKAQQLLKQLRLSPEQNFPLLNEATRLVQLIEGSVSKMPDGDMKPVWRDQVSELQKDLQMATARMLSDDTQTAGDKRSNGPPAGRAQRTDRPTASASPDASPGGLFSGLSVGLGAASPPGAAPAAAAGPGDLFSGLNLVGGLVGAPEPSAYAPPGMPSPGHLFAENSATSAPLPEDLFTGLEPAPYGDALAPEPAHHTPAVQPMPPAASVAPAQQPSFGAAAAAPAAGPSPWQSDVAASTASPAPDSRRRKKVSRRVGYARDEEDSPVKQPSPTPPLTASPALASAAAPLRPQLPAAVGSSDTLLPSLEAGHTAATGRHAALDMPAAAPASAPQLSSSAASTPTSRAEAPAPSAGASTLPLQPAQRPQPTGTSAPSTQPSSAADTLGSVAQHRSAAAGSRPTAQPAGLPGSLRASQAPLAAPQPVSASAVLKDMASSSVPEKLQALRRHAQQQAQAQAGGARAQAEQAARTRRRQLMADLAASTSECKRLEQAEAAAVEAEDFEAAATLSAQLDALRERAAQLQADLHAAEAECEAALQARVDTAAAQARIWEEAALAARKLEADAQSAVTQLANQIAAAAARAMAEQATGAEHVEELRARIAARQRWIAEEAETVGKKVEEATRPVAAERASLADAHAALVAEVDQLRAQLAAKEQELAAAAAALKSADEGMRALSSKYDKMLSRIEEDRRAVAAEEAERAEEEKALEAARARAAAAAEEAEQQRAALQQQSREALAAAEEMAATAAAVRSGVAAEQAMREVAQRLRTAQQEAEKGLADLEAELEAARAASRDASSRRLALQQEATAADEAAAAARRRLPGLEAEKKAAAAARDFKEAARLSAEAKTATVEAEAATARAEQLRARIAEAEGEQAAKGQQISLLEEAASMARRDCRLARWRRLKAAAAQVQQLLDAAVAHEDFDEAAALQAELDASAAEAGALAREHGFGDADVSDLAGLLPGSAAAAAPPAAANRVANAAQPEAASGAVQAEEVPSYAAPTSLLALEDEAVPGRAHAGGQAAGGSERSSAPASEADEPAQAAPARSKSADTAPPGAASASQPPRSQSDPDALLPELQAGGGGGGGSSGGLFAGMALLAEEHAPGTPQVSQPAQPRATGGSSRGNSADGSAASDHLGPAAGLARHSSDGQLVPAASERLGAARTASSSAQEEQAAPLPAMNRTGSSQALSGRLSRRSSAAEDGIGSRSGVATAPPRMPLTHLQSAASLASEADSVRQPGTPTSSGYGGDSDSTLGHGLLLRSYSGDSRPAPASQSAPPPPPHASDDITLLDLPGLHPSLSKQNAPMTADANGSAQATEVAVHAPAAASADGQPAEDGTAAPQPGGTADMFAGLSFG